jgi:hypothetical protein
MNGPPAGVGAPSAEQIAMMKEAGVRATFVTDLGMGFGPFILGYVLFFLYYTCLISLGMQRIWHYSVSYFHKCGIGTHGRPRSVGSLGFWW